MTRFDTFVNADGVGWLLDVQTDLLTGLNTRVVVPLLPRGDAPSPAQRLNPVFVLNGTDVVMVTQFLAAVPNSILGEPQTNLAQHHDEIVAALDMIFQGF